MNIDSIRIRNFRSLREFDVELTRLNIFVGKNDSGKSNVLRSLDLFFNFGQGYPFDWKQDFCSFAHVPKRKAPEIEVTLTISPPDSFSNPNPVTWTKVWRREGLHKEQICHVDRNALSPKNKFRTALRSARYDYVPAIKGEPYFGRLLGKMHDMLELTVEEEIRDAAGTFTDAINAQTKSIITELLDRLALDSSIELPPNLRDLFEQLDFRSIHDDKEFSLSQRGDGIKVRHIPIILHWLASQAETLSAPGRPKVVTVWGYEEPENNLELGRCQKAASEFLQDSERIQTFITTHSPAFYSIFRKDESGNVSVFGVKKVDGERVSKVSPLARDDLSHLDDSMGLMPLVAPYYDKIQAELEELRANQADLPPTNKPTLFVEGLSDQTILTAAILHFFPDLDGEFQIFTRRRGGYNWVADRLIAWANVEPGMIGIGLFDGDQDARNAQKRALDDPKTKRSPHAKAMLLPTIRDLGKCGKAGFSVPHAIEDLFPPRIWQHAENERWLEDRKNLNSLYGFEQTDITFDQHLAAELPDENLQRIVRRKVKIEKKKAFAKYVCGLTRCCKSNAFLPLEGPVEQILKALGLEITSDG